jgi:hypothetical protein
LGLCRRFDTSWLSPFPPSRPQLGQKPPPLAQGFPFALH